jgi:hypothetical protein
MNIPLADLFREHEVPTDEQVGEEFASSDECLMTLVRLAEKDFKEDNKRVWGLLRPLIYGTAAWDRVKLCDKTEDGCRAFVVLQHRGEGDAAVDARRTLAEEKIAKAQYTGKSKRFTLQNYINLLQGALMELEECGDPYSERKKLDTFVRGLAAERLEVYKIAIMCGG